MIGHYPPLLKKSAIALIVGILVLASSLAVSSPVNYLLTISVGSSGLLLGLMGYLVWFFKQLKEPG